MKGVQQEDCLYLNIFTPNPMTPPVEKKSNVEGALKKVMVFIHGGCFYFGCANQHVPGDFVALGDVIVVTINYRLSWLGFLKGPGDDVQGNMGMWDQLEALKWVKTNIKSFGGDPDDVTLAGQSMGGESVTAFSILQQAKHLFTKGIIMSGTMFSCRSSVGSSDVLLDMLVDKLGLTREGKTSSELIEEIKKLPEERFVLPIQNEITNKFTTIDGELFPKSFVEMKQDKEYLSSVGFYDRDYLVTLTNNEGLMVSSGPTSCFDPSKGKVTLAERLKQSESFHRRLHDWYSQPGHHEFSPLNDLFSDSIILAPTFDFLEAATGSGSEGKGNSYFLWFDHKPSYGPKRQDAEGTLHSLDLCYLFDIPAKEIYRMYFGLEIEKEFTEEDIQLKKMYIDLVVDFMHHGNANLSLAPHLKRNWPPFDVASEHYLNFGPRPVVKQFPILERRNFWKNIAPQWIKEEEIST